MCVIDRNMLRAELAKSRGVNYKKSEEKEKRQDWIRYEHTRMKSEDEEVFKSGKLERKLKEKRYADLDGMDMMEFYSNCVKSRGNKTSVSVGGKRHKQLKNLIRTYKPDTVYYVINFLFNSEQEYVSKDMITLEYVMFNIERFQAPARNFAEGKTYEKGVRKTSKIKMRQSDYSGSEGEDFRKW